MKKIVSLLLFFVTTNCFAPSGSGSANIQMPYVRVEAQNQDVPDWLSVNYEPANSSKQVLIPHIADPISYLQIDKIIQNANDVVEKSYTFAITFKKTETVRVTLKSMVTGSRPGPYFVDGQYLPQDSVVVTFGGEKAVLWGNSPSGSRAEIRVPIMFKKEGSWCAVYVVLVFEGRDRKIKIYFKL